VGNGEQGINREQLTTEGEFSMKRTNGCIDSFKETVMKNRWINYGITIIGIAILAFLAISCLTPDDEALVRGLYAYDAGNYEQAIVECTEAIRLNPNNAYAYYRRGLAYAYGERGDYDRAIADYDQAILLKPKNGMMHNSRAYAYLFKGDYDRAIAGFEATLRLSPNYADAKSGLDRAKQRQLITPQQTVQGPVTSPQQTAQSPVTLADSIQGTRLAEKFDWLRAFAQTNGRYIFEITADETIPDQTLSFSGKRNITLTIRGRGTNRTLSNSFTVDSGVTLILDNNITLRRGVRINSGGTLIMNNGAAITNTGGTGVDVRQNGTFTMNGGRISGNSGYSSVGYIDFGGGVYVNGGAFTMSGGTISGNTAVGSSAGSGGGGGVYMNGGTFTMSGGTISDNRSDVGGGVRVDSGTFTMQGGTIIGNTANQNGGGVYTRGTFTMSNGAISGNTAYVNGGGVWVPDNGVFTKTGGTIYGYSAGDANSNVVRDSSGAVQNYRGHAVWAGETSRLLKIKDTTAGTRDNLSYDGSRTPPTASGAWDN